MFFESLIFSLTLQGASRSFLIARTQLHLAWMNTLADDSGIMFVNYLQFHDVWNYSPKKPDYPSKMLQASTGSEKRLGGAYQQGGGGRAAYPQADGKWDEMREVASALHFTYGDILPRRWFCDTSNFSFLPPFLSLGSVGSRFSSLRACCGFHNVSVRIPLGHV